MNYLYCAFCALFSLAANWTSEARAPDAANSLASLYSDEDLEARLVGLWYGSRVDKNGELYEFITRKRPDGTFSLSMRFSKDNEVLDEAMEHGYWRVSDGVYQSSIHMFEDETGAVRPSFSSGYKYRIISLDDDTFEFEEVRLKIAFSATRVGDGFTFSPLKDSVKRPEPQTPTLADQLEARREMAEFNAEARARFAAKGEEFIGFFNQVCVDTNLSLPSIKEAMGKLDWEIDKENTGDGSFTWALGGLRPKPQSAARRFVLEALSMSLADDSTAQTCRLTMYNGSPYPPTGKAEAEMIRAMLLESGFSASDFKRSSSGKINGTGAYAAEIVRYRTPLSRNDNEMLGYDYLWSAGAHQLTVFVKPEGAR